ncbi:MAG: hypothetical protein JNM22_07600 [Saprospiraceae bacterium]|nr:hypothetical protein [Saprospiraceae bacterium]
MKQAAAKPSRQTPVLTPELKALLAKIDKADKAVQKAQTDFDKKQAAYKAAFETEPAKNVFLQIWSAMKIAKLTLKIKRVEYKLAKNEYKFAKKAAKKAEPKASKEVSVSDKSTQKGKAKKASPATAP